MRKKCFLHAAVLQTYINVLNILLYFKENYYLYTRQQHKGYSIYVSKGLSVEIALAESGLI